MLQVCEDQSEVVVEQSNGSMLKVVDVSRSEVPFGADNDFESVAARNGRGAAGQQGIENISTKDS